MDSGKGKAAGSGVRKALEARRSIKLMRRVLDGFRARLDDELRARGITSSQLRFLHEVKRNPGCSGAQMARACYITPQSAQALMVRAVKNGWVARGRSAENDRVVTARLTPAGARLLAYADQALARLEAEVWAGLGTPDLRAINRTLEHGLVNLEARQGHAHPPSLQ